MEHVNKEQKIQVESVPAALLGCLEHTFNPFQARSSISPVIAPHSRIKLRFTLTAVTSCFLVLQQASAFYIYLCFAHNF